MGLSTAERVFLFVRCPNCETKSVDKPLAWLIGKDEMICPNCRALINLESGDNGLRIQKLARTCAEIDQSISELDESRL
jgi:hypothetical protein